MVIDRLVLISTCGTSLLTNGATNEERAWLTSLANAPSLDETRFEQIVAARRARFLAADDVLRRRMSAEMNGIAAVLERYRPKSQVHHVLIHSDTAQGRATAEMIGAVLGASMELLTASGLRTDSAASFRAALSDLTGDLSRRIEDYRAQGWFVVFNLTGGFKGMNAYLQTLAMISADRCVFLFETAPELMEIPRLPVRLAELEALREHVTLFRRLQVGYSARPVEAAGVPESLLLELDDAVTTSPLGDVAWSQHRRVLLAERLYPILSDKVVVATAVAKEFDGLEPAQRVQVNEALAEFCAFMDHGRPLLKSRTFKKLEGDPVPGSTHELYAWSDGATGRLLGHYDGEGRFVFDRLTRHL